MINYIELIIIFHLRLIVFIKHIKAMSTCNLIKFCVIILSFKINWFKYIYLSSYRCDYILINKVFTCFS